MEKTPFDDPKSQPTDEQLGEALGEAAEHWTALKAGLAAAYPPYSETWKCYGEKLGWTFQTVQKKRTIWWMTPLRGKFRISTAFGEKAVSAARESDLPDGVLEMIESAKKYAEGRAVRMVIEDERGVALALKLAAIKMAN